MSQALGEPDAVRYTTGITRADDWIRTSMIRLTRAAPSSVEPRRHRPNHQGRRRESNPHLLVHSQSCRNRYTTATVCQRKERESNPQGSVCSAGFQPAPVAHRVAPPSVIPDGLEPSFPARHAGVLAAGPRDHFSAPRPGVEPGISSFEARRDVRFTIGAKAEGEGVEPASP